MKYKFKSKINQINFREWKKIIERKKIKFFKIRKVGEVNRDKKEFATSLIDTKFKFRNKIYTRAIHLEGDSVVIIPIIKDNKNIKTILIKQFRAAIGKINLEFVSGGVINKNFRRSAIREVKEELNIKIKGKDLIELNKEPIYLMPGNNFARAKFFAFIIKLSDTEIDKYNFLITGDKKNGEYLKTVVKNFDQLIYLKTASVIISLKLLKDKKLI